MAPVLLGRIAKAIEDPANRGTHAVKVLAPRWSRIMRAFTSVPLNASPGLSQNRDRADKTMEPGRAEAVHFFLRSCRFRQAGVAGQNSSGSTSKAQRTFLFEAFISVLFQSFKND